MPTARRRGSVLSRTARRDDAVRPADELDVRSAPARADRRSSASRTASAHGRSRAAASRCPGWRIALFALGIALLVVAVASPIAAVGEEELFSFHMTQHLLLGDLAPLCLLAGLTGPLLRPMLALPGVDAPARPREPARRAPDLGGEPRALAPAGALRGRGRVERRARGRARRASSPPGSCSGSPSSRRCPRPSGSEPARSSAYIVGVRLVATVIGNVFIWGGWRVLRRLRDRGRLPRPVAGRRPEPRGLADDARGLARHDRRARVALPAHGAGGRGAPGAASRGASTRAPCRRAVRYRRWNELA